MGKTLYSMNDFLSYERLGKFRDELEDVFRTAGVHDDELDGEFELPPRTDWERKEFELDGKQVLALQALILAGRTAWATIRPLAMAVAKIT